MESIKNILESKINKLLTLVLSLLGFSGCEGIGNEPVLYGCPYANYKAKGRVLNEAQEPVEGLDVVVRKVERYRLADGVEKEDFYDEVLHTDAKGYYEDAGALKYFHSPGGDSARIIVIDPMCVYATDSVTVRVKTPYEKGKGDWFQGTYLFEHDFQLKHADD